MNKKYWTQRASTWVSASVLAGGLLTACILFLLVRVESRAYELSLPATSEYEEY